MKARAVEHVGPQRVEWRDVDVPEPRAGQGLIQAECSAISAGTEALIFCGAFPAHLPLDATLPGLGGRLGYPLRYGYALTGRIVRTGAAADEAWVGRRVFVFHPHQDRVCVDLDACLPVPDTVSSRAACFLANTESAVNLVMDAAPRLGERFLVLGLGVLGLLTTAILAHFPLSELAATDPLALRREWAELLGASAAATLEPFAADGDAAGAGFDGVIELSGNVAALDQAIAVTGFGGRIVIGSWYGTKNGAVDLGGVFHRRRLKLVSSQVSTLAPELTARWNKRRRLALAWEWVRRISPERLITHVFPPERCQEAFELAVNPVAGALQVIFEY